MGYLGKQGEQPLTPVGQLFSQHTLCQVMNTAVTTAGPVDVRALKAELASSAFTRLPRFTSLMHHDPVTGRKHWRKPTHQVVVDDHVKVIDDKHIYDVNDYLADLSVSCPLPTDKPSWEVHVLPSHNCTVFRLHHALADGVSTISLLRNFCTTKQSTQPAIDKMTKPVDVDVDATNKKKKQWYSYYYCNSRLVMWEFISMVWFTLIYSVEFILRCLWVKDEETVLTGGDGVEFWPRKLATASFSIQDMKIVKNSVSPNATINDVVLGVLSLGLSEYMHLRSPDAIREGTRLTAITMSNLRSVSGFPDMSDLVKGDRETGWGNKIGFMLHPIYIRKPGNNTDPLWHLKEAQVAMNKKKHSKAGRMSYIFGSLAMKIISVDFAAWLMYRMACHSAFLFSNTMGPQNEIYMAGNLVTSIKASASSSPQAMTIHMVSYAGKAVMQILTAENLIPDPDVLAKCFEEALQNMKKRAALISPPKHQH